MSEQAGEWSRGYSAVPPEIYINSKSEVLLDEDDVADKLSTLEAELTALRSEVQRLTQDCEAYKLRHDSYYALEHEVQRLRDVKEVVLTYLKSNQRFIEHSDNFTNQDWETIQAWPKSFADALNPQAQEEE